MPMPIRKSWPVRKKPLEPRRPKFGSVPTTLEIEGEKHTYHSHYESGYAKMLHGLFKKGELSYVKEQARYRLEVNGKLVCTHIPDFEVGVLRPGNVVHVKVVEAKGYPTPEWKIKKKFFEALYPEIPYLVNPSVEEVLA